MLLRIYLSLFLAFCCATVSLAETFVVTSNADAGPGTLREALTKAAANGNTEKDYINFNLPDVSEAGRTITVQSQLPLVTSSIVIDGTSQPGGGFGRSDAKIILQPSNSYSVYSALVLINANGFELYGLYIRDFIGDLPFKPSAAIYCRGSKNVQIGAPGKGNVITNNTYIFSTSSGYYIQPFTPSNLGVENLKVYSNFFGFEPDGKSYRAALISIAGSFEISACAGELIFGGNDTGQRNLFGNTFQAIQSIWTSASSNFPTNIRIVNNYLNYNIDGGYAPIPTLNTSSIQYISIGLHPSNYGLTLLYKIYILNNKLQAPSGIGIGPVSGEIIFQGNRVIKENYVNQPNYSGGGLSVESKDKILIGGEAAGEANILYSSGIVAKAPNSILIQRNSVYCTNDGYNVVWQLPYLTAPDKLPVISINNVTATSVSGTATPLSSVELFWDDDCMFCQPYTYVTTIMADANGKWQYNGLIQNGVVASATLNGFTSYFTTSAKISGSKIVHYSCNNQGNISDIIFSNTGAYQWKNERGEVISTNKEAKDLTPGKYTLSALNGTCSTDYTFNIYDATPSINEGNKHIIQPSCSGKGSLTGLYLNNGDVLYDANSRGDYNAYTYKWLDGSDNIRSTSLDLNDAEAGSYRLLVTYKGNCTTTYGPITLTNTTGPNINETTASIRTTPCNQSTGGVTNLTITGGTGTLKYSWKNAQNQMVATTKDLQNQPAGQYTLQVNDDSACGPVYSSTFEITETNGITIDVSGVSQTNTTCNNNNGSITGINTIGASTYEWRDNNDQLVGTTLNLSNVGPGKYHLVALNATCSKVSTEYTIVKQQINSGYTSTKVLTPAYCNQDNGSIQVIFDTQQPKAVRWENNSGVTIGHNALLQNLDAGTYQLYVTDDNGCESAYLAYAISRIAPMEITLNSEVKTDDQCTQKLGSIQNVAITGGKQPYTYKWLNSAGGQIASTAALINVTEGTYELQVTDATGCDMVSHTYTIQNQTSALAAPVVASNIQLCGPGQAVVNVANPGTGYTYRIYDSKTGNKVIAEQKSSRLTVNVKDSRSIYISRLLGSCESPRTEVLVAVGVSGTTIPNTITPNGDGMNDLWQIKGMENYPAAQVQLFNRNGQKVFESRGYASAFDGTRNGQPLPIGTYFYIINLGSGCNLFTGSLTIIR